MPSLPFSCRLKNLPPTPNRANVHLTEPLHHWNKELELPSLASTPSCSVNATADRSSNPEQSTHETSPPPLFPSRSSPPSRRSQNRLGGACWRLRQHSKAAQHAWTRGGGCGLVHTTKDFGRGAHRNHTCLALGYRMAEGTTRNHRANEAYSNTSDLGLSMVVCYGDLVVIPSSFPEGVDKSSWDYVTGG